MLQCDLVYDVNQHEIHFPLLCSLYQFNILHLATQTEELQEEYYVGVARKDVTGPIVQVNMVSIFVFFHEQLSFTWSKFLFLRQKKNKKLLHRYLLAPENNYAEHSNLKHR